MPEQPSTCTDGFDGPGQNISLVLRYGDSRDASDGPRVCEACAYFVGARIYFWQARRHQWAHADQMPLLLVDRLSVAAGAIAGAALGSNGSGNDQ